MSATATTRRAVTLTEVLIAIFLLGIGLMAVLSLFPLGAAQMAQALQDQRAAEAATTADGYARTILKQAFDADEASGGTGMIRFVDNNAANYKQPPPLNTPSKYVSPHDTMLFPAPQAQQRFLMAMDDPQWNPPYPSPSAPNAPFDKYSMNACGALTSANGTTVPGSIPVPMNFDPIKSGGPPPLPVSAPPPPPQGSSTPYATPATASYPVLVDPVGWVANASTANYGQWWVGSGVATTYQQPAWRIPRRPLYTRSPSSTGNASMPWVPITALGTMGIFKQFSLMDDMTFTGGAPYVPTNAVERQGRYTWAYMFRRAHNSDRTAVEITSILYSGRSIEVASPETTYPGFGISATDAASPSAGGRNAKELVLDYTNQTKPALRRGSWVLDATLWDYDGNGKTIVSPQGYFYRVVNVDDSVVNQLRLELQTPLLGGPGLSAPRGVPFPRAIVVMDKVAEVFTKTDVARVAPQMPY